MRRNDRTALLNIKAMRPKGSDYALFFLWLEHVDQTTQGSSAICEKGQHWNPRNA